MARRSMQRPLSVAVWLMTGASLVLRHTLLSFSLIPRVAHLCRNSSRLRSCTAAVRKDPIPCQVLTPLSDITKSLRDLTQKDMAWVWDQPQQKALETLKKAVASSQILQYYSLDDEVTLQCDASQSGLGAALMQNRQPVAYASRALTLAENKYAQIIVFACNRFIYIWKVRSLCMWKWTIR